MHKSPTGHRNSLAKETSPYLLQHADNPVDWHPWGPEALELARSTGKPILLSIGYSACHWCHVMAHESFEDEATAKVMNELFVNIKVDREERPDIDKIYQLAHHVLAQRGGGWPLTMFLTHYDQQPFFGGTYFPNEPRYGMPAFTDLLKRVAEFYKRNDENIRKQNASLMQVFDESVPPAPNAGLQLDAQPLAQARVMLTQQFDREFGGFGGAPKFPHATMLEFLLRRWRASAHESEPDLQSLYAATLTLTRMAEGGIYDQLGGGFSRYSVDRFWMIPHFEKMLYDNGPLLALYAQAAVATGDPLFRRIANETADWMLRDMQSADGAFWSTLDADSEGHEGKFYVWQPSEVRALLTDAEYAAMAHRFGLDREPNFENTAWHLHVFQSLDEVAQRIGSAAADIERLLDSARGKLLKARNGRIWPGRDEKILTSWNALAIKGLAVAARALGPSSAHPELVEGLLEKSKIVSTLRQAQGSTRAEPLPTDRLVTAATRAVDFIRTNLWRDGRLLAAFKDGQARFPAYLDDYAFLLDALIELLQARWRPSDLEFATALADTLLAHFEDKAAGGFFFTADDAEQLIHRTKSFSDEAVPAGNGIAAIALHRLGLLLGDTRYLDAAERTVRAAWSGIEKYASGHASLLIALEEILESVQIIIVRGVTREVDEWQRELNKVYAPRRIVLGIPSDAGDLPPALAEKKAMSETIGYVCKGTVCSEPLKSLAALIAVARE